MFELFEGNHREACSVEDFIAQMPTRSDSGLCQELPPEDEEDEDDQYSAYAGSIIKLWSKESSMIQFWTPERSSSGVVMLTVSGQTFAIGEPCKGLCRYRYSCLQQDIEAEDITNTKTGPVGKVFSQGYHEFRAGIESSFSNFDFAKTCGIGDDWGYLALPLFECDNNSKGQAQQCVGVVEILSYNHSFSYFWYLAVLLKAPGIEHRRSDIQKCLNARRSVLISNLDVVTLSYLREELKSPIIQIWLPCMCDTTSRPANEFVCTWATKEFGIQYGFDSEYLFLPHASSYNPLVGRVYSENKACFVRDTTQLSISNYPFVHFTRSNDLKACFIFTLKTIHPKLHPMVLQVFLPRLQNLDHGNFLAQLNSLLSTIARTLSICNSSFRLQENEEFIFSNSQSEDDNVIFFDVHRGRKSMTTVATIGHEREDGGQNCEIHETSVITIMDDIIIREEDMVSKNLQITEEMREFPSFNQDKLQFPPTLRANKGEAQFLREAFNDEEEILLDDIPSGEEDEAAAETLDSNLVMLGSSIQHMAGNSKEPSPVLIPGYLHHVRDPSFRVQFSTFIEKMKNEVFKIPVDKVVFGSKSTEVILDVVDSKKWLTKINDIHEKEWIVGFQMDLWASFLHSQLPKEARGRVHIINTNSSFINYKTDNHEKRNRRKISIVNELVDIMEENKARLYVMPICSLSHWMMLFMVPEESIVYCIDSLQVGITPSARPFEHDLLMRVGDSYDYKVRHLNTGQPQEAKNWKVVNITHKVQPGSWECGYYTMLYMEKIVLLHTCIDVHKVFPEDHDAYPMEVIQGLIDTFCRHVMKDIVPACRNICNPPAVLQDQMAADASEAFKNGEVEIALEMINQYRGCTKQEDAAKIFGVSPSTLRVKCSEFGLGKWPPPPSIKCKEVHHPPSVAKLQNTILREKGKSTVKGDDESERCLHMTVKARYRDTNAIFPLHGDSIEELHKEVERRFKIEDGRFNIKYKHGDGEWITLSCNEDFKFYVETLNVSKQSTLNLEINTIEEAKITLEKINQYRGCTSQDAAAEKLGVSLSTLKRRCRELGLKRWPCSKRKKVQDPESSALLKQTKSDQEVGALVIQETENGQCSKADPIENEAAAVEHIPVDPKSISQGSDDIAQGNKIIDVMATYKDDTILLPLYCNSGMEELQKELDDAFQFAGEKFKIKYKHDDSRWITLFRDKDLRYRIDTLKASGQSTMELSVFPIS